MAGLYIITTCRYLYVHVAVVGRKASPAIMRRGTNSWNCILYLSCQGGKRVLAIHGTYNPPCSIKLATCTLEGLERAVSQQITRYVSISPCNARCSGYEDRVDFSSRDLIPGILGLLHALGVFKIAGGLGLFLGNSTRQCPAHQQRHNLAR